MPFDFAPLLNPKLPPAAGKFGGNWTNDRVRCLS